MNMFIVSSIIIATMYTSACVPPAAALHAQEPV